MSANRFTIFTLLATIVSPLLLTTVTGCAEGPLWKVGGTMPWVKKQWNEEEQIAETVYSKRRKLKDIAENAHSFSAVDSDHYAEQLANILKNEPTLIVRVESVRALARIQGEVADVIMKDALLDPEQEVRMAAVQGWKYRDGEIAVTVLRQTLGSDTDADVRREALRSLSYFEGPEVVSALGSVLSDRDPATQYRAIESLEKVTGESFGANVGKWREYLVSNELLDSPESIASQPDGNLK